MNEAELPHKPTDIEYDSNPFTISFRAFGLFVQHAMGVFITVLVIGLLDFITNIFGSITDFTRTQESRSNGGSQPLDFDVNGISTEATNLATTSQGSGGVDVFLIVVVVVAFVGILALVILIATIFSAAYKGFVAAGTVAAVDKRDIRFSEALSAMVNRFGTLFVAEILATLRIIGGYLLLFVPGIRAQLRYQSTPYIIMRNPEIKATAALNESKQIYRKHLMEVFGILTVGAIIPFVGSSISSSGIAMSAKQVAAYASAGKQTPKTHWLNYLGLILLAVLAVGLILLAVLVTALIANS